jgi:hypothetical protein
MSLVEKHLNFNNNNLQGFLSNLDNSIQIDSLYEYQELYKKYQTNSDEVFEIIKSKFFDYIKKNMEKIFIPNVDINYILDKISFYENIKFYNILKNLHIDSLISMMDYNSNVKNNYIKIKKYYYSSLDKGLTNVFDILNNDWSKINLESFVKFSAIINKLNYNDIDIEKYKNLISEKFDEQSTVIKFIDFIKSSCIDNQDSQENINDSLDAEKLIKYNFRFILDNMKSNAYLLFEEYYKNIRIRYSIYNGNIANFPIDSLRKDIRLTKYFIYIIANKEKTNINRYVNEILLKTKNYLYDVEDSYNNNYSFYKMKFNATSEKYKNINLSLYKRDIASFQILKYNFSPDNLVKVNAKLCNLEPYIDMYKTYYSARYPDRDFEIDFIKSTLIVKINSLGKPYFIHLALIQYVVLDIIMNNKQGICAKQLASDINVKLSNLNETFNSLLKIKLIKRTSDTIFIFNDEFTYDKSKISICGLIKKDDKQNEKTEREFLHDRSIILLCNLVNFSKHNSYFTIDVAQEKLSYKVPFKFSREDLEKAITESLKESYIKEIQVPDNEDSSQTYYQYEELE